MDSLTILFEAIDSLGIEADTDFKQPSFDLHSFTQAKPWQYGEKLFQAILDVRVYSLQSICYLQNMGFPVQLSRQKQLTACPICLSLAVEGAAKSCKPLMCIYG